MSKVLIYSQEDLDLILELEKEKNEELQQENKQLKEQLLVAQTNEDTLFDDVKAYSRSLKDNWNELKRWLYEEHYLYVPEIARNSIYQKVLEKMYEIEKESNSNEI